jgi:hypothetical protein
MRRSTRTESPAFSPGRSPTCSTGKTLAFGLTALLAVGCGGDETVGPEGPALGDPDLGRVAFQTSCASCHASGDGFDLAFFGFPDADIVRRAAPHVDSATARDIAAYVETLPVTSMEPDVRPFQPGSGEPTADPDFWRGIFDTEGWPDGGVTVEHLRGLDLRDETLSIPFPRWSSEVDESDWMPEEPLPDAVLDADGGAVRAALDAYYASPADDRLLEVVRTFRDVSSDPNRNDAGVCAGGASTHRYPRACFEARRWVSSLAAVHLFRKGEFRQVPYELAHLWWETGEAAVTVFFDRDAVDRVTVASWLAMSSTFAPGGFPSPGSGLVEAAGYMGQFLQSSGRPRLAVAITLRRLVSRGPVHADHPVNAYRDAQLATLRAPREMVADVLEFGLGFLLAEQAEGRLPSIGNREHAVGFVDAALQAYEQQATDVESAQDDRIRSMIEQVRSGLEEG